MILLSCKDAVFAGIWVIAYFRKLSIHCEFEIMFVRNLMQLVLKFHIQDSESEHMNLDLSGNGVANDVKTCFQCQATSTPPDGTKVVMFFCFYVVAHRFFSI